MSKNGIINMQYNQGSGCPGRVSTLPAHNPEPSTDRGRRRHDKRNESQKNVAAKAWGRARTTNKSRYQKALASSH